MVPAGEPDVGPDGALYVVDMYRAVIEHPDFVPDELKKRPDLMLGNDRGRIWRIVAKDSGDATNPASGRRKPADKTRPPLSKMKSQELLKVLEHKNAWWRETAQRLIVERQDTAIAPQLVGIVTQRRENVRLRIHGLWILRAIGRLPSDLILRLLERADENEDPRVCEQFLILSESEMGDDTIGAAAMWPPFPNDDSRWRFQQELSLAFRSKGIVGGSIGPERTDRWFVLAKAIRAKGRAGAIISDYFDSFADAPVILDEDYDWRTVEFVELMKQVRPDEVRSVLESLARFPAKSEVRAPLFTLLDALGKTLRRHRSTLERKSTSCRVRTRRTA